MNKSFAIFTLILEKDFVAFCNQKLHDIGITQGLLYFIIYIGKHPGCTAGDMTRDMFTDWGYTQRSVDKLVQDDFVHKQKNEQDRRSYNLSLTTKGENAFTVSHQVLFDWDSDVLQELSAEEKKQLFIILEKLVYHKGENTYARNNQHPS